MVSVYLRAEIFSERITGKSIWQKLGLIKPVLPENITIYNCKNTEELYQLIKHGKEGTVIITQSLRLSNSFFKTGHKVLQIVGGRYPEYIGDTSIFWAKATGNKMITALQL